jgi:hypothetical protein
VRSLSPTERLLLEALLVAGLLVWRERARRLGVPPLALLHWQRAAVLRRLAFLAGRASLSAEAAYGELVKQ